MNPIINQIFGNIMQTNPVLNLFKTIMSAKNPDSMMQMYAQQNPQIKQVMDYINQNGGNAKQLYYNVAKQKNTDPNIIINQLKSMM